MDGSVPETGRYRRLQGSPVKVLFSAYDYCRTNLARAI
jgi:hypothetical protein